ncbi:hypothetical protein Ddye_001549 [Dipteronia dyeriana]|uniref:Uncharacterized protein n=1 Tax=Dipteronia dyeriana TaxID=168575 RepID=A0AAD9XPG0_9ROSI|nr:hypothetical protein Ddye_001549 [Dipteronia dyeriana]
MLMPSFWNNVVFALKIVGPLVGALRLVDSERKSPMGYMYEAMDRTKEAIAKYFWMEPVWYLNPKFFYNTRTTGEEVATELFTCIERLVPDVETRWYVVLAGLAWQAWLSYGPGRARLDFVGGRAGWAWPARYGPFCRH